MTITVTQEGATWIVRSAFADKDIVKAAGCRWNPDRKVWWTDQPEVATKLAVAGGDAMIVAAINADRAAAHAKAQASIEASRAASADITVPAPKGLSYLGYQLAGVAYAQARDATLIADEMGLGKTIQALGLINADKTIANVLVVCPASLKLNWKREAQKWLTRPLKVSIANGAFSPGGLVIVNYEQVKKYRAQIDAVQWDLLIVDEAHYLKNGKADRTAAVLGRWDKVPAKIVKPVQARRKLFLTGTPILNRPNELWTLLQAIDKRGLGANWKAFHGRYCDAHPGRFGWDISGASHLDELQAKLRASVMIRRMKADVLTELPAKRRSVIAFTPESVEAKAVVAREAELIRDTEENLAKLRARVEETRTWNDPAAYKKAVEDLSQGNLAAFTETAKVRHEVALAKVPQVIEHVRDVLENGDKLVIMAHHHDVIDWITDQLSEFGAVKLDGRMSLKDRDLSVSRFQTDKTVRVFVGGIQAAGVGITLTAASHVVFAELDWVPGNLAQAEDRCHRIGQTDSVLVQHLVLDGSLDARMAQIIVDKMDVIAAAVDAKTADAALAAPKLLDAPAPAPERPAGVSPGKVEGELSGQQVQAVHDALRIIAGLCDGAQELDGQGFNKLDTQFGHDLAMRCSLSQKQAAYGRKLVVKYGRQVPADLLAIVKGGAA